MKDSGPEAIGEGTETRPRIWFWVVAAIGLVWYAMDMSAFFMRVWMIDDVISQMPEDQRHLYLDMPLWVNVVFAGEVFGGVLGCLALLLKKGWALPLFLVSLAGVLGQTFHVYFLSDAIRTMGTPAVVMPLVAILISVGMIGLTRLASARKWLS